jgi:hypothetical protein
LSWVSFFSNYKFLDPSSLFQDGSVFSLVSFSPLDWIDLLVDYTEQYGNLYHWTGAHAHLAVRSMVLGANDTHAGALYERVYRGCVLLRLGSLQSLPRGLGEGVGTLKHGVCGTSDVLPTPFGIDRGLGVGALEFSPRILDYIVAVGCRHSGAECETGYFTQRDFLGIHV